MKKRALSFALALCLVLALLPATALAATTGTYAVTGGNLTYSISGGSVTITDCDTSVTEAVIPDKIGDYSVTSIGGGAFNGCTKLSDIYYGGSSDEWNAALTGSSDALTGVVIHCSSSNPHVHSYTDVITAPTCTEQGYTTHTCSCGDSYVDTYVDAAGHSVETKNAKEAACTEAGYTGDEVCTVCGETVTTGTEIAALGHEYENGVCVRCGEADPNVEPTPTVTFDDVSENDWFYNSVAWAVENDITNGTGDNCFSPMRTCTRSEIVTFLWRAAGEPEPTSTENPFSDVADNQWYTKAVLWAVENNITGGTGGGCFSPNRVCTRCEIVTFLYRAAGEPEVTATDNPFPDVSESAWYYNAVLWAVEKGITQGTSSGFEPNNTCTRAEAVTFLQRYSAL